MMRTCLCFSLFFACTVTVTMCGDTVVTKDNARRWVVRAKPGTITETTNRKDMAHNLARQYKLEGHPIGALHEWFIFEEKEGEKPIDESVINQIKGSDHFSEVRLEVGRNRVTKT